MLFKIFEKSLTQFSWVYKYRAIGLHSLASCKLLPDAWVYKTGFLEGRGELFTKYAAIENAPALVFGEGKNFFKC